MRVGLLSDFFMDIKNWIYNWDTVTFVIALIIIILLIGSSLVFFIKGLLPKADKKPKFKIIPVIFIVLLVAMLIIILSIRK